MNKKIARTVLRETYEALQSAEIENAKQEAELLFFHCMNWKKLDYMQNEMAEVPDEILERLDRYIMERKEHKPLQYILGEWEFMGLPFSVGEGVLIPRQDTELLVETILEFVREHRFTEIKRRTTNSRGHLVANEKLQNIYGLDLCTGSGCIPLSLAYHGMIPMVGADISEIAISYSKKNAETIGRNLDWYVGDLFDALPKSKKGTFTFIVSNPPYIRSDVIPTLMDEVKDFEPSLALDGGADGLIFYERIVKGASDWLADDGWLFFEIGYDQGEDVKSLMMEHGFSGCEILNDWNGLPRVVFGQLL